MMSKILQKPFKEHN